MVQDILNANRVYQHTNDKINNRILTDITKTVLYYEKNPDQIENRLEELSKEWDIERILETNASILALFGVAGVIFGKREWIILPLVVLSFLLQHAIQGWCPPIEIFRRMGIRTREEITREQNLLRAVRGDYNSLTQMKEGDGRPNMETLFSVFPT